MEEIHHIDDNGTRYALIGVKNNYAKMIVTYLLSVLSGGLLIILMYKSARVLVWATKTQCEYTAASYMYLKDKTKRAQEYILPLHYDEKDGRYFTFHGVRYELDTDSVQSEQSFSVEEKRIVPSQKISHQSYSLVTKCFPSCSKIIHVIQPLNDVTSPQNNECLFTQVNTFA